MKVDNVSEMERWEKMVRDKMKGTSELRVSGVEEERGGRGGQRGGEMKNKRGRDGIEKKQRRMGERQRK